ncbi:malate synthase G [Asticcacaulis biprosthecium C19]|uniref:Malate synthase G n=1 Tax=Asticcacaulis biprosthecium C19 TaxID=715226 RepID=F4QLN3_9CAUL|nr:malate synthase G [Asticcacaulis biprosthecium]EGF93531.1 malate synthase G [Asticcacaulis biprosthecium C19]
MTYVSVNGYQVAQTLHRFISEDAIPGSGIESTQVWHALTTLLTEYAGRNQDLLKHRDHLQAELDNWHRVHPIVDPTAYQTFLRDIGYLTAELEPFEVTTENTDDEIAKLAGPQLVVPVSNARYALNAANARWGSLYDALYGTDALGSAPPKGYDPMRGAQVQEKARQWLDSFVPLERASHADVIAYHAGATLMADTATGPVALKEPAQYVGHRSGGVLLRHHGLHLELVIDPKNPIGAAHPAGLADIIVEAASSAIMDMEDSVAAVDADDKVGVYRNWLGLTRGDLTEAITKGGQTVERRLNPDRDYTAADGSALTLHGRSLMLARNVGLHMYSDMVLDGEGSPVPEGLVDLIVTALIARHDGGANSRAGSAYIVKPKLHGPDEVAFAVATFARAESLLDLPQGTLKIGIMDEERRTSASLKACIRAAADRVFFINTGFLDRTGDEIHSVMEAGPVVRKADMKKAAWITAYENANVDDGLICGLPGHAQIGKGMWAAPDRMNDMLSQKIGHPQSGASTAWVPSPTAAVLHAIHYHLTDVVARQAELRHREPASQDDLLTPPVMAERPSDTEIQEELDNNLQGILGYVVRWIDFGVGCSKVPDIHDIGLMEDRATLRISSQHVANWLRHGLITTDQVEARLRHMAAVVDRQNAGDPAYVPMAPAFDGLAFRAARDLVLEGRVQPNGYTEFVLHRYRKEAKARSKQVAE